jgi:ribosomal protein S18 acetylase RimI-like enzyme
LEIRNKLEFTDYTSLGELLYESFKNKLTVAIDSKRIALNIINDSINYKMGFYAFDEYGELVGVLGIVTRSESFYKIKYSTIRKQYPLLKSLKCYILLKMESIIAVKKNELFIVAFTVKTTHRHQGIGTRLFHTAIDSYKKLGYRKVKLSVIENNDNAKRLYKKLGFLVTHKYNYGFITRRAGFSSVYIMEKYL